MNGKDHSPFRTASRCWFLLLPISGCLSVLTVCAFAQNPLPATGNSPVTVDLNRVHFYLITVDVGDRVWDNFGHTALRVYNESNNDDQVFNWGVFDTSGGLVGFSWRFFKGVTEYRLAINSPSREFAMYRGQQRTVWQDKLNLTNAQKEILYRRLVWNQQPENVAYAYQYFQDNCTTRVRDYLDEALGGRISRTWDQPTDETYRDQVRAHYRSLPLIALSLDVLMNGNIDRPVSEWEEMYLPLRLRERLLTLPSGIAEQGQPLMLLTDSRMIMQFEPPTAGLDGYRVAFHLLAAPLVLLLFMLKRAPRTGFGGGSGSPLRLRLPSISFRLLGLAALFISVVSGVYGCLMLGSWFVSAHTDTHNNVNLLLFWPTDLLGVLFAMRWLWSRKPWPVTHNSAPFIHYYLLAHILATLVYWVLAVFSLTTQSIAAPALYLAPGMFVLFLLVRFVGFEPARSRNMFS